mmetsp:Transcript_31401/g.73615  ORF Transcript_31401/g.73615 Transcript_31401/m.73615 type:complete len:433 (+) Transcript_31401:35-1333(+)
MATTPLQAEGPVRGGYLHEPTLTDSLLHRVCSHRDLGCQILWKICQPLPKVPLVRRTWLDKAGVRPSSLVLTEDRIAGPRELRSPQLDEATKTALQATIDARTVSGELKSRLEAALGKEFEAWCRGDVRNADDAFSPLQEQPEAENLMRYMRIGVVNWHRELGEEPYPKISGDARLRLEPTTKMIQCNWDVESLWYNTPSLHTFPFDSHEMSAIFWTRVWRHVRIEEFGRSYALGTSFQEFDVLGFRGDPTPCPGWDPYICESNVVPNRARTGELMFYGRFWVRRKPFYFIVALLFPTAVVTFMGASAILIASGEVPNGIVLGGESPLSLVAGLMLTMVAMKFSYTESVPKLGYLTMLDTYIAVSFLFLSAAALLIVLLPEELLQQLRAAAVFSGLCLLFNIVYAVIAYREFRIPVEHSPRFTFPEAKAPPE